MSFGNRPRRSRPTNRAFSAWLYATGAAYALGTLDFVVRPRAATASLNSFGGEAVEDEHPPGLYNSLAAAYMATIAALALTAASDPGGRRALIPPLLVGKAASSSALLARYLTTRRRGFALGAALDALIFGVTAGFYSSLQD